MPRLFWLVLIAWMAPSTQAQQSLNLMLVDYAGLSAGELDGTAHLAKTLLGGSGVETRWSICRSADLKAGRCYPKGEYSHVRVVVERELLNRNDPRLLGWANVDTASGPYPMVYAFSRGVETLAMETSQPRSVVLACVIVHELLHLLGLEHTEQGIMRPRFRRQDMKPLSNGLTLLSNEQLSRVRARAFTMAPK